MAQQADSEAISLVIQKLTEIVENQNRHSSTASDDSVSFPQVAADDSPPNYREHGSEILLAEDSIAVVEEVVGASAHSAETSPTKSDQGHASEEERDVKTPPRQVILGSDLQESEQVILNFPVKVGNLNITSTEGLIATLQKLDNALQQGADTAKVSASNGQDQPQGQAKELYKCAKCDYWSHNKHYLKQHVELTHNADRPFKCPFCNYAGKRSHSLKEHLIVHSNCRPYSCPYCNATFRKKGHLTNHVKMHVNHDGLPKATVGCENAGYQCGSCSFVAASLQDLSVHAQTHNARQLCKSCHMFFADANSLALHINAKHATRGSTTPVVTPTTAPQKEVILVCSECGYKTGDKKLLTEHMMKHIDATDDAEEEVGMMEPENQTKAFTKIKSDDPEKQPRDATTQNAMYRCAQCSFSTKTTIAFIQHMLLHKPQKQAKTEPDSSSTEASTPTAQPTSNPPHSQVTLGQDSGQPFTHDKTGNFYRCSICGYTCELQRTIKSHIWKHSGHHDIDYPMFRNGPISVYDDYPIGVPVLMSENAPVMQVEPGTSSSMEQQTTFWAAVPNPESTSKPKEAMLVQVRPKKTMADSIAGKDGGQKTRHKTISQILAQCKPSVEEDKEQGVLSEAGEIKVDAGHPTTELRHKAAGVNEAGTLNPASQAAQQTALPTTALKLPIVVKPTGVAGRLPLNSSDGSAMKRTVVMMVPKHAHKASSLVVKSPTLSAAGQQSSEEEGAPPVAEVTTVQSESETAAEQTSTVKMPVNISLPGSEILKLIVKNRLQPAAAPSGSVPPVMAKTEQSTDIERSLSVTAEASSSVGDDSTSIDDQPALLSEAASAASKATVAGTVKRKRESVDELELYCLTKKLCTQSQVTSTRNVVVEDVSESYSTPQIRLSESRGASPRGLACSPRSSSPRPAIEDPPTRVLRGRSRSAEEVRKPPSQVEDQGESQEQASVTLISLLKKGPNLNPACPPTPHTALSTNVKDEKDGDKPKQGISSSLLAVIEQLRERSRSESEPDDFTSVEKPKTRKRGKRGSADDEDDRDSLLRNYANIEQLGEQYRCKLCHYTSASAALLKVHIRQHKVKRPLECSLCEFVATSNKELQGHMLKHCKVRTYQCKLCSTDTSFAYKSQLRAHMRIHAEQSPYLCDHCDFQGTLAELKQHMLKHDRVYYVCHTCEATFESQEEHRKHEAECGDKPGPETPPAAGQPRTKRLLQCTQCDFLTNSQTALLSHAAVHKGFEVQCELCNFTATSMRSLKSHMKRHINDQKFVRQPLEQYKCNLCGYVCHHLPSLKSHMWRHASDTNYSYQDSNDIINAAIDLDQDQGQSQTESEEKEGGGQGHNNFIRFRCCQCGFESVDRSELSSHMQSHEDIIQKTLEVNQGRIMTGAMKSKNNSGEDSGTDEDSGMVIE